MKGDDVDELSNAICKMQIEPSYNEYLNKASVAAKSFLYSEIAKKLSVNNYVPNSTLFKRYLEESFQFSYFDICYCFCKC